MTRTLLALLLALPLGACTSVPSDDDDGYVPGGEGSGEEGGDGGGDEGEPYTGPTFRLGTFNIEWLRDSYKYRTAVDYEMVAMLIEELEPTVIGLQEIDSQGAIELLYDNGLDPRFKAEVGREGGTLRTVILYDSDQVTVSGRQDVDISPDNFRDLNVAEVKLIETGERFVFGTVHLASEYDSSNTATRRDEVLALDAWLRDDVAAAYPDSRGIAIVGDYNDTFAGVDDDIDTLQPLEDNEDLVFATRNTNTYTQTTQRSKIDHIVLDLELAARWVGADDETTGCIVYPHDDLAPYSNYEGGYEDEQNISDHRPVLIDMALLPD